MSVASWSGNFMIILDFVKTVTVKYQKTKFVFLYVLLQYFMAILISNCKTAKISSVIQALHSWCHCLTFKKITSISFKERMSKSSRCQIKCNYFFFTIKTKCKGSYIHHYIFLHLAVYEILLKEIICSKLVIIFVCM